MRFVLIRTVLTILFCVTGVCAQTPTVVPQSPIEYELGFGRPNSHLLEVTVRARGLSGATADFAMPAWNPGWYVINNYARMVQEFRAADAAGKPLRWRKSDKQTWRVELAGGSTATIQYKVYGNTLGVDWMQYNDKHAHIAGPAAWMYLAGGKHRPAKLSIATPQGWRIATGMPRTSDNTFTAPNYDAFVDYPVEISDYSEQAFTSGGATYHVVVHDILGKKDYTRLTQDAQKAVEQLVGMMKPVAGTAKRDAPFESYWFLFHVWPNVGGGLEHRNSTQIFLGGDWATPAAGETARGMYRGQLGVTVHEFFHAYNVKRLRPRPLEPFDYSREAHTPSLWIAEGLTNYYEGVALLRAGLQTPEDYFSNLGDLVTGFENLPGRKERSIEETSWDTWFWYTGEGPIQTNKANTDHSYYTGGEILGHFLDFAIRNATNNRKSLDDWMRLMYSRYALPKPGYTPEQAIAAASEIAGRNLSGFFRRHISGKEPLPYEEYFAHAGIRVERKTDATRAWLGAGFTPGPNDHARITSLRPTGPAMEAGLHRNDVITNVDGQPATIGEFSEAISRARPGESVRLTVQRLNETREISVTLAGDPTVQFVLSPIPQMTETQRAIYRSWSGQK